VHYLHLIKLFAGSSTQNEMAYRMNFWISLLNSILNLGTGVLGVLVLFGQVEKIRGWDQASTLAILGVYLIVGALQRLFIGPSLNSLAGMDGEVWSGKLDYTLIRPVDIQFLASFRYWQPLALIDLLFGGSVIMAAVWQMEQALTWERWIVFFASLSIGMITLYAILLIFAGLVFWSPGFLFTWIFDSLFQMGRYPVGLYPDWLQLVLTWIVPVGIITTVPAQALTGTLEAGEFISGAALSLLFLMGASIFFRYGLRRYASASS
jgi:ABC-2 type transport system permease protein